MPAEINAYDALYIPANDVTWFRPQDEQSHSAH